MSEQDAPTRGRWAWAMRPAAYLVALALSPSPGTSATPTRGTAPPRAPR